MVSDRTGVSVFESPGQFYHENICTTQLDREDVGRLRAQMTDAGHHAQQFTTATETHRLNQREPSGGRSCRGAARVLTYNFVGRKIIKFTQYLLYGGGRI